MQCAAVRMTSRAINVQVQDEPREPTMVTIAFDTAGEGAPPPPNIAKAGCAAVSTVTAAAKRIYFRIMLLCDPSREPPVNICIFIARTSDAVDTSERTCGRTVVGRGGQE